MGGRIGGAISDNKYQICDSAGNAKPGSTSFIQRTSRGTGALSVLESSKVNQYDRESTGSRDNLWKKQAQLRGLDESNFKENDSINVNNDHESKVLEP